MARTAKRYKKNTEKKISGIPVCMAAIYARLSVDNDEKKSESIETQVTLIKEFIQKHNENPDKEYEIAVYDIYSDLAFAVRPHYHIRYESFPECAFPNTHAGHCITSQRAV